jgi:hypothetical protein
VNSSVFYSVSCDQNAVSSTESVKNFVETAIDTRQ